MRVIKHDQTIIRQRRKELGISVEVLAQKAGVGVSSAWAWDRGASIPRPKRIETLALALDMDTQELMRALHDAKGRDNEPQEESVDTILSAAKLSVARLMRVEPAHLTLILSLTA